MSSPPPTSAVAGGANSVASSSSAPIKICFNSFCKDPKSAAPRRKGWRLRSGEHAELCERCFFTYEQGTFCDAFHKDTGGWRNCESCGKRLHCGCIVSAPAYMLLDGGGIDCVACARKNLVMGPKPMWASPSLLPLQVPERPKELPVKGRNQVSGQFPGQWRHAANLWNVAGAQSELHQRLAYEFDRPTLADKMLTAGRSIISSSEKKIDDLPDRTAPGSTNHVTRDKYANGTIGQDSVPAFNTYAREEGKIGTLRDSGHLLGANDSNLTRNGLTVDPRLNTSGLTYESHPSSSVNLQRHLILKGDPKSLGTVGSFSTQNDQNDPARSLTTQPSGQTASPLARQSFTNSPNLVDPSGGELQAQMCNGRPRADPRARSQLLRYCPKTTDQELHQVSGESNPQITHLFEKILSASDAGRIGRLVLPKKCAEAYFPKITHSEGLPLKVQDGTGNEWVFQFRFWPNNNSRMYVLEGVTACIQSMQLQAGDTVTFSRIDPEGKLVMGYRKASSISPEQENHTLQTGNVLETPLEANSKNIPAESFPALPLQPPKGNSEPAIPSNTADQGTMPKLEQPEFIQKNESAVKSSEPPSKRKGSTVGPKSKRLRIDQDDSIQLKLTWAAAQDLLRPPPNGCPSIVIIDGHAFEEYKQEAPVIGMPTYIHTNQDGEKSQWTLCESCSKWRKLPVDALLPSGWTCSENLWDHKRSSCSVTQELTLEQLAEFLPIKSGTTKRSKVKVENDVAGISDGLDTLANLAIQGVGEEHTPSTKTTTKHPRHRAGCTCIVCIQPPSGKGPKHKEECACNVCLTVKRRFKTLKLKREKRDPDQDIPNLSTEMSALIQSCTASTWKDNSPQKTIVNIDAVDEESEQRKPLPSPLKAQIDLNIQPEREEEPSPVASASGMSRAFPHVIN